MIIKFKIYEQSSYSSTKIFENINEGDVEIDDFILINSKITNLSYHNNIGKVTHIDYNSPFPVRVIFENELFSGRDDKTRYGYYDNVKFSVIEYWSKNREDLEAIVKSRKYNI